MNSKELGINVRLEGMMMTAENGWWKSSRSARRRQKPKRASKAEQRRAIVVRIMEETIVTDEQVDAEITRMGLPPLKNPQQLKYRRRIRHWYLWQEVVEAQLAEYGNDYKALHKEFWREYHRRHPRPSRRPPKSPPSELSPRKREELEKAWAAACGK